MGFQEEINKEELVFRLCCHPSTPHASMHHKQPIYICIKSIHCHSGGISELQSSITLSISSRIYPFTNYLSLYSRPPVTSVPLPCFQSHWYSPSQTDPSFQRNTPLPCLRPFCSCPSQLFPLLYSTLAQLSTPKWKVQFSYWVLLSASQKTFPLPSSGCYSICIFAQFLRYSSGNKTLNSAVRVAAGEEKSTPPPWYLLCLSVPLYQFPLAYLILPKMRCPSNTPTSVAVSVYLTPSPFLLPASNSPSYTSPLKISLPWKCFSPDLNCPMYLEVLDTSMPLPCSRESFHQPTYLMPCMSFCSTVYKLAYSLAYSLGIQRNSQSSSASLWQKDKSNYQSRSLPVSDNQESDYSFQGQQAIDFSMGWSLRKTVECSNQWSTAGGSSYGLGAWLRTREW